MTWPKPDIPIMININKPKTLNWLLIFCLYLFLGVNLVWFNRNSEWLWLNFIGYFVGFWILFCIVLACRVYYYFIGNHILLERYTYHIKSFHENWYNWANESIAVFDSYFVVENSLKINELGVINIERDNVIKFSESSDKILFSKLRDSLSLYPRLNPVKIILISNQCSIEKRIMLEDELAKFSLVINPIVSLIDFKDEQFARDLLEKKEIIKELTVVIISNQGDLNSSAFIGYFILIPDNILNKNEIYPKIKAYLLRALLVDENDINKAITQLIEMQPRVMDSKAILATHWYDIQEKIILLLQKLSEHCESLPEPINLDQYIGKPSVLSYWLSLHLACELTQSNQAGELVMSQFTDKLFFNMVVPETINN